MQAMHGPIYRSRLAELVGRIVPHLNEGDRVLDVGCGNGTLGRALMDAPNCPKGVVVEGLERVARGGEPIKVHAYAGGRMPFDDGAFDAVILADVLHHEPHPEQLLDECRRVSRRLVIIKDHQLKGFLAKARVSFIDWAANAPYGVPCLYRYNTQQQWGEVPARHRLEAVEVLSSMKVYPPLVNLLFGGSLHYFGVLKKTGN
jgi:ubiquinone/menaquinone biosynthesis C-methylase UbiE